MMLGGKDKLSTKSCGLPKLSTHKRWRFLELSTHKRWRFLLGGTHKRWRSYMYPVSLPVANTPVVAEQLVVDNAATNATHPANPPRPPSTRGGRNSRFNQSERPTGAHSLSCYRPANIGKKWPVWRSRACSFGSIVPMWTSTPSLKK